MTQQRLNILVSIAAFFLLGAGGVVYYATIDSVSEGGTVASSRSPIIKMTPAHPVYPFDRVGLFDGLERAKQKSEVLPVGTRGGIIPHHTLPSAFLAEFFSGLRSQAPTTIVLIGPNHSNQGDAPVLSSDWDWETPFGTLSTDWEYTQKVRDRVGFIAVDNTHLSSEHSVAGVMPYIKYFLPEVKVVPLIVKSTLTRKQLDQLSEAIADQTDDHTVIVASVDFSHYLTAKEAEHNDTITAGIIEKLDTEAVLLLNNDFVDSPASIGIFLETMKHFGAVQSQLLNHSNSGFLEHTLRPTGGVTSYFVYSFY